MNETRVLAQNTHTHTPFCLVCCLWPAARRNVIAKMIMRGKKEEHARGNQMGSCCVVVAKRERETERGDETS